MTEALARRVLLTGATGFIGRACIGPLAARGFDVHALTIDRPREPDPRAEWHVHDLLVPGVPAQLIDAIRPSHLLHMAWYVAPGSYWTAAENVDWVSASTALVNAFQRAGGRRFVGAGTCAEYAAGAQPCDERTTAIAPASLYGTCKHAVHAVVESLARGRFSAAWGRIFFLYGPHEHEQRLVPGVIRALLAGEEARCTAGTQVRDFMHVEDVADAFAALVASDVEGAVNIASGQPARLADVVMTIARQLGAEDRVRLGARPMPAGEPASITAATARLRDEVRWTRARSLERGLADAIAWWKARAATAE